MALDPVFAAVLRIALVLLFAVAALHKARDLRAFASTVEGYALLPIPLVRLSAPLLVSAELATLVLLVARAPLGPAAALSLLFVYSLAIAVNLARGRRDIDCGCLGPAGAGQHLSGWLLARNAVLAGTAALLLLPETTRVVSWIDWISVAGGAATIVLLWSAANGLARGAVRSPA